MNILNCCRSDFARRRSSKSYVRERRIGAAVPHADRIKIGSASGAEKQRSASIFSLMRSGATCRFSVVARMKLPRRNQCGEERCIQRDERRIHDKLLALLSALRALSVLLPQTKWPQESIRSGESVRDVRHCPVFFRGSCREPRPIPQPIPTAFNHADAI